MRPDTATLKRFYETPLGDFTADALAKVVAESDWADRPGGLVTLGYAIPILKKLGGPRSAFALMPARQGAEVWPKGASSLSALVEETSLPLADASVANMLLVHTLEFASNPSRLMREVWRVLEPEGRAVFLVPNRRRMWSSLELTPFGHGTPWSWRQLEALMIERMLQPVGCHTTLFFPPIKTGPGLIGSITRATAKSCERPFLKLLPASGGLLVVEVKKKVVTGLTKSSQETAMNQATVR